MNGPRTARPAQARALTCPNCGAAVSVQASGSTVTATCPACATLLDVANDQVAIIAAARSHTRSPLIPIGTRGVLAGTEWQVVGWQVRTVQAGSWPWDEFLLFNPFQGFRFLLHDHGAWGLFRLLRQDIPDDAPAGYRLKEANTARTEYVLGEFYWRIRTGDEVAVREFVQGTITLSQERSGTEVTWSQGEPVDVATLRTAFGLPALSGEQRPDLEPWLGTRSRWLVAAAACAALAALVALPFGQYRNQVLTRQSYTATAKLDAVSPDFDVPGRGGDLAIEAVPDLHDTDATVEAKLLPVAGGDGFTARMQFSGWFESGGQSQSLTFASVPGGRYRLATGVESGSFPSPVGVVVTVRRHPVNAGQAWLALAAILAWPVLLTGKRALFRLLD